MSKKLIASLILLTALSSAAIASDRTILFVIDRDGNVSLNCLGTIPTDFDLVKTRLVDLKRSEPKARIDFVAMDGAPTELVSKYRKLVISQGFNFGKSSGPCN